MSPGRINDLDKTELDQVWKDGRCNHSRPTLHLYGIFAQLECDVCNQEMLFRLKFGRPKTFEVAINNRPVGYTFVHHTQQFIDFHSAGIVMPDEHTVAGLRHPLRDSKMLEMLIDTLFPMDLKKLQQCPVNDYKKALYNIPCRHKSARCQIYADTIGVTCKDCKVVLLFRLISDDAFNVRMTYDSSVPVEYGIHYIREVINTIQEFVNTLGIPNMMADYMSDDPERDAYSMIQIVRLFMEHGLLEYGKSDEKLSAMGCSRAEFEKMCVNSDIAPRILEKTHISWPYKFIGRGIGISYYNIIGSSQYCVRCSFSTLDDKGGNWREGCPHCGYVGYLLDLDTLPTKT